MGRNKLARVVLALTVFCSSTTVSLAVPSSQAGTTATTVEKKANQKLHRADFRVTGASCVGCLRRVSKILRTQKGVLKADVSIFKPHWAIVIYDGNDTNLDQLAEACKVEKVKFEEIENKAISELPLIVIPKGMSKPLDSAAR